MKKHFVCLGLIIGLLALPACTAPSTPKKATAPLATDGSVAPPPGCVELRQRGGAC